MSSPLWNQRIFYELLCYHTSGRRWLDLGCGRGPDGAELQRVRQRAGEKLYVGVDMDMDSLRDCSETNIVFADVGLLPFPDGSFDIVTSNMVFEHLEDPATALREAHRVLDQEGVLIVHTASSLHYMLLVGRFLARILPRMVYADLVSRYTGRRKEDIFPTCYRANTARKFSRAAAKAGFKGGFITHLDTPLDFPKGTRSFEVHLRRFLPKSLKGTILALYIKRQWT